jgi:restriction endonuclease S subunit
MADTPGAKSDGGVSRMAESNRSIMASVDAFKSAVIRIRDILRGPGVAITGMDSMRHICLYLLSRYITRERVVSLGVPAQFAWENLIETAQTVNGGMQKALDWFFHKETDCLVYHFDRLFGTENFSFDVKSPAKHKEILEILDAVNIEGAECHMDILGWVYEQHLKTGSSAARDLGQFFTDRFICDYMVDLCKPGFKSKDVPESVCDPSMGTGGFLTSYMKFYKKHYADKSVDWSVQNKEIHGCDTDPKVAGVARLNLFMESGGNRAVNLRTHDSLYGDLTQTGYDLILANMPFGLKGIKHAECCERVKELKIRGTKSEPLFLQLMMVSLNRGGRCAVVVPDGMLVNGSSCHDETRKYLLDHFELKRVIKMKGQFFMNTGIQPSILFFENTGKPTSDVEFWDVIKASNGHINETMVLSVPRAKFDASCSFDMRRYQEVTAVANPAGFPMVKLSDVCDFVSGKGNYTQDGDAYPYYDSNGITGTRKDYLHDGDYIITARKMSIGAVHYATGKFWASDNTIVMHPKPDSNQLSPRFLYYWLLLNNKVLKDLTSGIKPGIRKSDVMEIKMPLPPIETQKEIVATLDRIYAPGTTELAETLNLTDRAMDLVLANPGGASLEPIVEAQRLMRKSAQMVADVKAQMVADVKAQMAAIMKSIDMRGFPRGRLGESVSFLNGYAFTSEEFISSGVPIVKIKNIKKNVLSLDHANYSVKSATLSKYTVKQGDMVISLTGELSGDVAINLSGLEWYLNQRVARIDVTNKQLIPQYLYYYMVYSGFTEAVRNLSTGSAQPNVSTKNIESLTLSLPPVEFQESVIGRLNALQTQVSSLENLCTLAEENARFILDSYLNTP